MISILLLCHKWPGIGCTCSKYFPVLSSIMTYYRVCSQINTTGTTSEAGTATLPEYLSSTRFSGVRVTRYLVLCVCFVDRCMSFCAFSFGHCVVCPSSIYGFRLPLCIFKLFFVATSLLMCSSSNAVHRGFDPPSVK